MFKKGLVLAFMALLLAACSSASREHLSDSSQTNRMDMAAGGAAPQVTSAEVAPLPPGGAGYASGSAPSSAANASAGGAAGAGVTGAGAAGTMPAFDPGLSRKMIYTAQVTIRTADFDSAETKLQDAIHLSGAYILQFSNQQDAGGKSAYYVVKVPANGFSSFLGQLREIEKDLQIRVEGNDVTEEYVDLEARLEAKKAAEARLLALMEKATGVDDLVRFSAELAAVQEQIEQIKGRMRYLDQNVAYSTVNIRLYEQGSKADEDEQSALGHQMIKAMKASASALGQFGQALLIFLAAFLPVAAVLAVIGIPLYLFIRSRVRGRKPTQPHPGAAPPDNPNPDA